MKKIKVPMLWYRVISIFPLVFMLAALALAYLANAGLKGSEGATYLGTVRSDISWKVRLKDNPFFPTKELGSDYTFIRELVDKIQFDMKIALDSASDDTVVKINYRVDGVLRANSDASSSGLLLMQEYPRINQGSAELSANAASDVKQFELSLTPYTHIIQTFQSDYRIGVSSKMDLNIDIDAVMESGSGRILKSQSLALTIPLDSNVFEISGSPSDKMEFSMSNQDRASARGNNSATLFYLGAAVLMLLITVAVFLFFTPPVQEQETALLKQAMHKCKGSLVAIKANPKDADLPMLPVDSIDGLVSISESTGQPILYYNEKDDHLFLVSSDEILYSYELKVAVKTDPGHVPAQGKAAL